MVVNSYCRECKRAPPAPPREESAIAPEGTPSGAPPPALYPTSGVDPIPDPPQASPEAEPEPRPSLREVRAMAMARALAESHGMSKFSAAPMRAKSAVLQVVQSYKLTAAEYLDLDVPALLAEVVAEVSELTDHDRDLIQPMNEDTFEDLRRHDARVRKNTVWVKKPQTHAPPYEEKVAHNKRLRRGIVVEVCECGDRIDCGDHAYCHFPDHLKAEQEQEESFAETLASRSRLDRWCWSADLFNAKNYAYLGLSLLTTFLLFGGVALMLVGWVAGVVGCFFGIRWHSVHQELQAEWMHAYPQYGAVVEKKYGQD